ncbi:MAG: nucleotide sugar dehydrogenase [Acidobacteria bacterium]|nr:nucleotide sugar dehydrogenase [Acidobacteriota bacterium]
MPQRIGVIGAGYVGLVTGACLASMGHQVTLRDIDEAKVRMIGDGEPPIHEDGLKQLMHECRDRLRATLDLAEMLEASEIVFIAVDTPPTHSGDADLSRVMTVLDELEAIGTTGDHVLVMKSTVPVGTGERVRAELDKRGLESIGYCSNPEFLKEGVAIADFLSPDRMVIGDFRAADGDKVAALYEPLGAPILRTSVPTAEMIKYASNAFLATKISFINEIANVCEEVGADVTEVAEGMGLDARIGPKFLSAGVGFGGSCLDGEETLMVREGRRVRVTTFERLWADYSQRPTDEVVRPDGLEVATWTQGAEQPVFGRVEVLTRRPFTDDLLEVRTKMGRRLRVTPDHPMLATTDPGGGLATMVPAAELTDSHWVPIALGTAARDEQVGRIPMTEALSAAGLEERDVIARAPSDSLAAFTTRDIAAAIAPLAHHRTARVRSHDIARSGALRIPEMRALGLDPADAMLGTATNGMYVPGDLHLDPSFWRVAGLYAAEGHVARDGRRVRISWSFHPTDEEDLVALVLGYWRSRGVRADLRDTPTARTVVVSSRLLGAAWTDVLGFGRNSYEQRVPDALWTAPAEDRRAFLAGAWRGDGSWSFVSGGPSVVLEYGTVSRQLAEGLLRVLGEFGVVARVKVGRTAKSTCDTYWLVISGADQVERCLDLIDPDDTDRVIPALARTRRIAPTGYRRDGKGTAWVRVTEVRTAPSRGHVYSLEVPGPHTVVTSGGVVVHNCFPKDVSALKQLAGNSGYHFQLLTSVIEVNELQKRRVVGKLKRHLGDLEGREIALLGLAFKPGTDDMREASSVVLAARLLAEAANVRAYDPVAIEAARHTVRGVEFFDDPWACVTGADAVVLVTEWPEIIGLDWTRVAQVMRGDVLVDGRNALDPADAVAAGFAYEGIGRVAPS